jgi:spore coat polysaccharide biosynthesis protein SpsF (cytidylyltransferase family)
MALLDGRPVIQHVIERAKLIRGLDKIVMAFPDDPASQPMIDLCEHLEVATFCDIENRSRSIESDVLNRYWRAASEFGFDTIMRITGDCPLIHPGVCGDVLEMLKTKNLDYTSNVFPTRSWPKGYDCEVFTWECLDAAQQSNQPFGSGDAEADYNREHVTPWMQNTDGIRRGLCTQANGVDESDINLCIDFPEDLDRVGSEIAQYKRSMLELAAGGRFDRYH